MAKKKSTPKSRSSAKPTATTPALSGKAEYDGFVSGLSVLLDDARRSAVRAVNSTLSATYWEVGRRIVEFEQAGKDRAEYGEALLKRLAANLTATHGRGFGWRNLFSMRAFYLGWAGGEGGTGRFRSRLPGADGKLQTPSATSPPLDLGAVEPDWFPLPWSLYVRLLSVESPHARRFYEEEAVRGAWSVRQLDRQVNSLFYERTALSRNKAAMIVKGQPPKPEDSVAVEEHVRDPFVLEFLDLKDEYSESDLEQALVRHLETFLLELGDDFCFVGRQRRLRLDDKWFKVDLVFFHRGLRCLVVIDLKLGEFTHADAGQMNLYLNYAKAHWTREGENPPVGLILCAKKGHDEARYALEGLGNKVLASTYRMTLPDEKTLVAEIGQTRRMLELRPPSGGPE